MDIAVILFDQLGAKWLEKASELGYTPNIDNLKMHGTEFTRCYTSCPICVAARASMLTGLHPRQHGIWYGGYSLDPEIPTYMSVLKRHGYKTGGFGKFHITPECEADRPDFTSYGFDEFDCSEDWDKWQPEGFMIKNGATPLYGKTSYMPRKEDTQTEYITEKGESFIRSAAKDVPICVMVSYVEPHDPICPPKEYLGYVNPDILPDPLPAAWRSDPDAPSELFDINTKQRNYSDPTTERMDNPAAYWRRVRHYYFADIVHLDEQVGRIQKALDERGGWKNACIILSADHGEFLGDMEFGGKGSIHYDADIRLPMIISTPECTRRKSTHLAQSEDLYFTVLDAAGHADDWFVSRPPVSLRAPSPLKKDQPAKTLCHFKAPKRIPGLPTSLLPICRGEEPEGWRTSAASDFSDSVTLNQWTRTVITDQYRYTYYAGDRQCEQLFDLANDPDELENRLRDPAYAQVLQEMRMILNEYPLPARDMTSQNIY